jgi:hypothetical protein
MYMAILIPAAIISMHECLDVTHRIEVQICPPLLTSLCIHFAFTEACEFGVLIM